MGPQGPAQGPIRSGVGVYLVTSARKRQDSCSLSHSLSSHCSSGDKALRWLWADLGRREVGARPPGPSMAPTTGRRGRRGRRLLPGAELAPLCPAGPACPWPSSAASALWGDPAATQPGPWVGRVHVCEGHRTWCRYRVSGVCTETCGTRCRHRCKKDRKTEDTPSGNQGIESR